MDEARFEYVYRVKWRWRKDDGSWSPWLFWVDSTTGYGFKSLDRLKRELSKWPYGVAEDREYTIQRRAIPLVWEDIDE